MPDRYGRRQYQLATAQVRQLSVRARRAAKAVETVVAATWTRWIVTLRTNVSASLHRVRERLRLPERTNNLLKRLASEHPREAKMVLWLRYHTHHGEPDHQDDRYPRNWSFRFLRFFLRFWWLVFVAIMGVVIANLIAVVYTVVLPGKPLHLSAVLRAMLVDHVVSGLQRWPMPTLLVACGLSAITWSGRWAARDCKHEIQVVERRKERQRIQRQIEDHMRQQDAGLRALEARWQAFQDRVESRFGPLDDVLDDDEAPCHDTTPLDTPEEPP